MKSSHLSIAAIIALVLACLLLLPKTQNETVTTEQDVKLANRLLEKMYIKAKSAPASLREQMVFAGENLLGTPYVGATLDEIEKEALSVFLTRTDCILFVETCYNLARVTAANVSSGKGPATFDDLCKAILQTRYREGRAENYSDRIHYTTEWIRKGEAEGRLKDMTLDFDGVPFGDSINFMSTHPEKYRQLKDFRTDTSAALELQKIREVESSLNEIPLTYIPEESIVSIEDRILSGDIVCFMASTKGLDIAHVALAYVQEDPTAASGRKVGFMHASYSDGKVVVDELSIADYVASRKSLNGIKIVRALK